MFENILEHSIVLKMVLQNAGGSKNILEVFKNSPCGITDMGLFFARIQLPYNGNKLSQTLSSLLISLSKDA